MAKINLHHERVLANDKMSDILSVFTGIPQGAGPFIVLNLDLSIQENTMVQVFLTYLPNIAV